MITKVIKTKEETFRIIITEMAIKCKDKSIDSRTLTTFRCNLILHKVLKSSMKASQSNSIKISMLSQPYRVP